MKLTPEQKWGLALRKLRVGRHFMTQADLAAAANLHPSQISQLERGTRTPSAHVYEALRNVFPTLREPADWQPRVIKREDPAETVNAA